MTNLTTFSSIDSVNLERVTGGAEQGPWEAGLGKAGRIAGGIAGGMLGSPGSPITSGLLAAGGQELGGLAGRQLGRAIDNPGPAPTGGVNGGNGAEQLSP